jgi:hypothetical protein
MVPEDEIEEGSDGRPMCCCCRLKEQGDQLAEKDRCGRSPDPVQKAAELPSQVHAAAPRDLPSSDPQPSGWASSY